MVGRVFVVFCVVENVVAVDGPLTSDPLVDALVGDSLLGELVLDVVLRRLLEVSLLRVDSCLHVFVAVVAMVGSKSTSAY